MVRMCDLCGLRLFGPTHQGFVVSGGRHVACGYRKGCEKAARHKASRDREKRGDAR